MKSLNNILFSRVRLSTFALSTALLVGGAALVVAKPDAGAARLRPDGSRKFARFQSQTVPITVGVNPGVLSPGDTATVTVTVGQVPSNGGSVQITTQSSSLTSPSGCWPYIVNYAPGASTTASFTVTVPADAPAGSFQLGACQSGADASSADNWSAGTYVAIVD